MPSPGILTPLASGSSATDASSYTTASFSIGFGILTLAFVSSTVASGNPNVPTIAAPSGNSWSQVTTQLTAAGTTRLTVFRMVSNANESATRTISFAGQTQTGCEWSIFDFDNPDTSGTNGSGAIVQSNGSTGTGATNPSWSLSALLDVNTVVVAGFRHNANEATTPKTLWTEIHDTNHANPNCGFETQWKTNDTLCSASWATSSVWLSAGVEVTGPVVTSVNGSQASTTSTANAGTPALRPAGTQATSTSTANVGTPALALAGTQATSTSTANAGTPSIAPAGSQATSAATANSGTPAIAIAGSQATETDTANGGTVNVVAGNTPVAGSQATSSETANAGAPRITLTGALATETDSAQAGAGYLTITGSKATSTETANAGTPRITVAGSQAVCTETTNTGTVQMPVSQNITLTYGPARSRWDTGQAKQRWDTDSARSRWRTMPARQ